MREIDAWAIAIDETDRYTISEVDTPFIKQIRSVYLFDRNQSPSYWLIHLYDQVILVDDDDPQRDRLYEDYEHCSSYDGYKHCGMIDRIIEQGDDVVHYGDPGVSFDDVDYDDQMESLREHLCSNCPL